jgi:N-acylneuraminate cytidylyltransferase
MRALAIIPARGGSKRIPNKNIKLFCGRPIIEYSISAAISSNHFEEVMVSTDSEEISQIAKNAGAKVPFMRSKDTSGDFAKSSDVILEVVENYRRIGREFDYIFCIYPTAPFVTADKLNEMMKIIIKEEADSVITVSEFEHAPQRALKIDENGYICFEREEYQNVRTQDLPKLFYDCGQVYGMRTGTVEKYGKMSGGKCVPYIVNPLEVQDIDTETDWILAELKYKFSRIQHGKY